MAVSPKISIASTTSRHAWVAVFVTRTGSQASGATTRSRDRPMFFMARLSELAAATDEEFDKAWKDAKETWHGVSQDIEHHWRSLSDRVKSHLA